MCFDSATPRPPSTKLFPEANKAPVSVRTKKCVAPAATCATRSLLKLAGNGRRTGVVKNEAVNGVAAALNTPICDKAKFRKGGHRDREFESYPSNSSPSH